MYFLSNLKILIPELKFENMVPCDQLFLSYGAYKTNLG